MEKFISLVNKALNKFSEIEFVYRDIYTPAQILKDQMEMEKKLGIELPRMMGFQVLVKVEVRDEFHYAKDKSGKEVTNESGEKIKILIPDANRQGDKFSSNVGLVCAMGPNACLDGNSKYFGPLFRIGQYVTFPPSAGLLTVYKGVKFKTFIDQHAIMEVNNPEDALTPLLY